MPACRRGERKMGKRGHRERGRKGESGRGRSRREEREERGREGGEILLLLPLRCAYARMQERGKEDGEERASREREKGRIGVRHSFFSFPIYPYSFHSESLPIFYSEVRFIITRPFFTPRSAGLAGWRNFLLRWRWRDQRG